MHSFVQMAEEHLRKDLEGALQLGNHKFFTKVHVDAVEDDYANRYRYRQLRLQ